jgi:hypothetical protein
MNKKYDNNNIIITSRAYFLQGDHLQNSYINTAPLTSFLAPLPGIKEEEAPTSTTHQSVKGDTNQ